MLPSSPCNLLLISTKPAPPKMRAKAVSAQLLVNDCTSSTCPFALKPINYLRCLGLTKRANPSILEGHDQGRGDDLLEPFHLQIVIALIMQMEATWEPQIPQRNICGYTIQNDSRSRFASIGKRLHFVNAFFLDEWFKLRC